MMVTIVVPILLALALPAAETVTVPAGTQLSLRMLAGAGTKTSKVNDTVEAAIIAPVLVNGRVVPFTGVKLLGKVKQVRASTPAEPRPMLVIEFSELAGPGSRKTKIPLQIVEVDNARESVDAEGRIMGILGSETLSGRMDQGIQKLSERFSGLAGVLQAAKGGFVKESDPEIDYSPGVELSVKLTKDFQWDASADGMAVGAITPESELNRLVTTPPFETRAENPPKPSDITNLMFIGSEQALTAAFQAAGWTSAAALSGESKMATVRAVIEARGYKEAPMSILLLDNQKPDFTFQKQNNTFAKRHHLRIWRRPEQFGGKTVWVSAATHDTGIEFSPENRTFIHKIDGNIDRERAKVANDLLFTGKVKGVVLVPRPAVPTSTMNATGDKIETDGSMAVLLLE